VIHETVHIGSTGSDVFVWQKIIGVKADGIFGPMTEAATREWQSEHSLKADGIVGPLTWQKAMGSTVKTPVGSVKDRTKVVIQNHEGRRSTMYLDSEGHPSVGIGFNLDRSDARARIGALGLDYDAVRAGTQSLSDAQIDRLFNDDFNASVAGAKSLLPNFNQLSSNAQIVLVDMVFNMGLGGVAGFTAMLSALSKLDYRGAVSGMKNSKWASQVPSRASFDMNLMLTPDAAAIGLGTLLVLGGIGLGLYYFMRNS